MALACMLHAHLAFIYRNIEPLDMDAKRVFTILACQIFLFNNYKYDLDLDLHENNKKKDKHADRKATEDFKDDLGIPQVLERAISLLRHYKQFRLFYLFLKVELFDLFQRNRLKVVQWLAAEPEGRNAVNSSDCHIFFVITIVFFLASI